MERAQSPSQVASGTVANSEASPNGDAKKQVHRPNNPALHNLGLNDSKSTAATIDYDSDNSNNEQVHSNNNKLDSNNPAFPNTLSCSSDAPCDISIPASTFDDDSQNASHMNNAVVMPLERPKSRTREVTAPLPSVPPCSPSLAIVHRVTLSHPQNQAPNTAPLPSGPFSALFIPSPTNSPSIDSQVEFDSAERSDSPIGTEDGSTATSVEIIYNCLDDSELSSRFDGSLSLDNDNSRVMLQRTADGNTSIDFSKLTRPSVSRTTSTSTQSSPCQTPTHVPVSLRAVTPTPATHSSPEPADRSKPRIVREGSEEPPTEPTHTSTAAKEGSNACEEKTEDDYSSNDDGSEVVKTLNVYINGLPPHFADESLFEMTRGFGNVLSVRTFTRCVGEKMSGYGFVLFDSVDAAEQCIETLRKYRNLHPSFSKQVHKIPGTPYANGTITIPPSGCETLSSSSTYSSIASFPSFPTLSSFPNSASGTSLSSVASSKSLGDVSGYVHVVGSPASVSSGLRSTLGHGEHDMSFKEKMTLLKDERSTNLYMEGLPLSIDDTTLAALVSPYRILSSRLFQTKLSDPPRMIAFVRLESRQAAEEIIERLHGRVVRGWNDNGGRISVRFADSNEQRELRRAERLARGEEEDVGAASRLSMAQAALLNLRGAELRAKLDVQARQQQRQSQATLNSFPLANQLNSQQGFQRSGVGKHPDRVTQGVANGFQHSSMILPHQQTYSLVRGSSAVQAHRNGVSFSGVDGAVNLSANTQTRQVRQQQRPSMSARALEQQEYAQMLDAAMRGVRAENVGTGEILLGAGAGADARHGARRGSFGSVDVNARVQGDLSVGLDPAVVARRLANPGIQIQAQSPVVHLGNLQHGVDAGYDALMLQQARLNEMSLRKQQQMQQLQAQMQAQTQGQGYVAGGKTTAHAERLMPSANITSGQFADVQFQQQHQNHQQRQRSIGHGHGSAQGHGYSDVGVDADGYAAGYDEYAVNEHMLRTAAPFHGQQNVKQVLQQRQQHIQQHQQHQSQTQGHVNSFRPAQHAIPEEDEEHRDRPSNAGHGHDNSSTSVPRSGSGRKASISTVTSDSGASDVAVVSPALTYASQTPSTLSPATPLFNTGAFATPASAPASVGAPKKSGVDRGMMFGHGAVGAKKERERAFSVTVRPEGGL